MRQNKDIFVSVKLNLYIRSNIYRLWKISCILWFLIWKMGLRIPYTSGYREKLNNVGKLFIQPPIYT